MKPEPIDEVLRRYMQQASAQLEAEIYGVYDGHSTETGRHSTPVTASAPESRSRADEVVQARWQEHLARLVLDQTITRGGNVIPEARKQ